MTPESEQKLRDASPMLFGDLPYFECADGWTNILLRLASRVNGYQQTGRLAEPVQAVQVKEKFGHLRVYVTPSSDLVESAIANAHDESRSTCEFCGAAGELRRIGGWLTTRCEPHYEEARNRRLF